MQTHGSSILQHDGHQRVEDKLHHREASKLNQHVYIVPVKLVNIIRLHYEDLHTRNNGAEEAQHGQVLHARLLLDYDLLQDSDNGEEKGSAQA